MEDLENDLSMMEIEARQLKNRLDKGGAVAQARSGSIKVTSAIEIAALTAEAPLAHDLLSSLTPRGDGGRGRVEQYRKHPRASFE